MVHSSLIILSGTTLILIATNAFTKYESLTGGKLDSTTGLLKVTLAQFSQLKSLVFQVNGVSSLGIQFRDLRESAFQQLILNLRNYIL